MLPEITVTTVIIVFLVIVIVLVYAQCRSVKKEYKWHSDMLLGAKDDEVKSMKEKISDLESQLAVKDTVISELSRMHNSDNEKLWSMSGILLDKVTKPYVKCTRSEKQ